MPALAVATHAQLAAIAQDAREGLSSYLGLSDYSGIQYLTVNRDKPAFRVAYDQHTQRAVCVTLAPSVPPAMLAKAREVLARIGVPMLPVAHTEGFPRFLLFARPESHEQQPRRVYVTWWESTDTLGMPLAGLRTNRVLLRADDDPLRHTDESHIPTMLAARHGVPAEHVRIFAVAP